MNKFFFCKIVVVLSIVSSVASADLVDFRSGDSNFNPENTSLEFNIIANIDLAHNYYGSRYLLASGSHNAIAIISCKNGGIISGGNYVTVEVNDRSNQGKTVFSYFHQERSFCESNFQEAIVNNDSALIKLGQKEFSLLLNRTIYGVELSFGGQE